MSDIHDKINQISSVKDHYLVKARQLKSNYFVEFIEAERILRGAMTSKEYERWCQEKMLLKLSSFLEKPFIQYAIETSVVRSFAEKHYENFKIEVKVNPNNDKNIECQFTNNGFTYNVEVKCAEFDAKEKVNKLDGFKRGTIGRIPNREKEFKNIEELLNKALDQIGESPKPHLTIKNMDNNLKDFLESAHQKFNSIPKENEVNILIIGCDDAQDVQTWVNYLYANEGLFTHQSFTDPNRYNNVDLVVLTNLYFKHHRYFEKRISGSWSLSNSFNIVFDNPFRKLAKKDAIENFHSIFPDYRRELDTFRASTSLDPDIEIYLRITWFVNKYLQEQRNLYLFEDKLE